VEFLDDLAVVRDALAQPRAAGGRAAVWLIAADAVEGTAIMQAASAARVPRVAAMGKVAQGDATEMLSRPITYSALRAFLKGRDEKEAQAASTGETMRRRAMRERVLLVEDDPVNRLVVSAMIEGREFQCIVAVNGSEALQRLRSEHFDAVLMDWQMPDMDGLEVTRHLRAGTCGELNRAVPVIALTANAFAEDRNACLAAGMNDFLTKPVQAGALLQCVQRWCRSISAATDESAPAAPISLREAGEVPAYDPTILGALCADPGGSNPVSVRELLDMFCSNIQSILPLMEAAAEAADWHALQRHTHTLKGSAGQIGAMALSRRAASLDARLRAGQPGSTDDVEQLRDAFAQFTKAAEVTATAA
jgi:CheY-like chemotaxis protein/HPt (histidine-containing phosphotransfer) domain-containing protein